MKNIVYIDGQNFLYKAAETLIEAGIISDKQELIKIDIRYILETLFKNQKLEIKYFGVNSIKRQEHFTPEILEKSKTFADNLRRTRNYFKKTDIEYCGTGSLQVRSQDKCKKCGYIEYKMAEKGVDVGLASELIFDSFDPLVQAQIIVSSDVDMLPAIKVAKRQNKEIDYVCFYGKQIHAISYYANKTRFIETSLIIDAFTRALKS